MSTKDDIDETGENGATKESKAAKPGLIERAQGLWEKTGINRHTYPLILKGTKRSNDIARYTLTHARRWSRFYRSNYRHLSVPSYGMGGAIYNYRILDWDNDRIEHRDPTTSEVPTDHDDPDSIGLPRSCHLHIGDVLLCQGSPGL